MSFDAHRQETGQYGLDHLSDATVLTISESANVSDNGWAILHFAAETTVTTLTDSRNSTGLTATYPAGFTLFGLFHTTITIAAGGDVVCYRRKPNE